MKRHLGLLLLLAAGGVFVTSPLAAQDLVINISLSTMSGSSSGYWDFLNVQVTIKGGEVVVDKRTSK
jgi:hypothetical protein